jgi:hypothetical protein
MYVEYSDRGEEKSVGLGEVGVLFFPFLPLFPLNPWEEWEEWDLWEALLFPHEMLQP